MAGNKVNVYKVSATYSPVGGNLLEGSEVDSITIFASVNSVPYAEIGLQPGSGATTTVYQMSDSLQVSEMEALQRFAFTNRASSRVDMTLTDTQGAQTMKAFFIGVPVAPAKNAGFGFVDQKIKLYGRAINFNAFRPYIYAPLPTDSNAAVPESESSSDSSNVLQRAVELVKARMERFQAITIFSGTRNAATLAMAKEVHDVNLKIFPSLEKLATLSTEAIYESFDELKSLDFSQQGMIKTSINNQILNLLLTSSGNFFETLTAFLGEFQLYYVPDVTGSDVGKVRPFRTMLQDTNISRREIDSEYLNMTAEDYDYGPIQQVLVQGVFESGMANTELENIAANNVVPELQANTIIVYPETVSVINGNFRPVGPPVWLPSSILMFDNTKDKSNVTTTGGWKIEDYVKARSEVAQNIDRVLKGPYYNILKEYSRNIFLQSSLASYTCVVRVPLDYSWELGKRYEITSVTGEVLFRGFLTQLNHSLSGIRNNLSAWTTLVFSHVEYGAFKLE